MNTNEKGYLDFFFLEPFFFIAFFLAAMVFGHPLSGAIFAGRPGAASR
jgi:hypothetical protein